MARSSDRFLDPLLLATALFALPHCNRRGASAPAHPPPSVARTDAAPPPDPERPRQIELKEYVAAVAPHAHAAVHAAREAVAACLERGDETSAATVTAAAACLRREREARIAHLTALRSVHPPAWLAPRHQELITAAVDASDSLERFADALVRTRSTIDRQRHSLPVFAWWADGASASAGAVRAAWADRSAARWEAWVSVMEPVTNTMLRCFENGDAGGQVDCSWERLEGIFRVESMDRVVLASDTPVPPFVPDGG